MAIAAVPLSVPAAAAAAAAAPLLLPCLLLLPFHARCCQQLSFFVALCCCCLLILLQSTKVHQLDDQAGPAAHDSIRKLPGHQRPSAARASSCECSNSG
jgi:hypothetical protein